jgi:ABC-type sugar transport system permease subunit
VTVLLLLLLLLPLLVLVMLLLLAAIVIQLCSSFVLWFTSSMREMQQDHRERDSKRQ